MPVVFGKGTFVSDVSFVVVVVWKSVIRDNMNYAISEDIRGLIFDFDGTIVDSMPVHFLSWREAFAKHGADFTESFCYRHAGVSLEGVVKLYNEAYGTSLNPALIVAQKDEAHQKYLFQTPVIPQIIDIINSNFGKRPMAVATGNTRKLTEPLMNHLGLQKYFRTVIYGEEVTHPKPHPESFLLAAAAIGVEPAHCEVFEDGDAGLEGARRAGMKATDIRPWLASSE